MVITPTLILFLLLAAVAVAAAIGMLRSPNAVHSALFLVINFAAVAILYLLLNAPFIAMAQITVYAGAIMVLFLFVIMMLGAERLPLTEHLPWQRPVALILSLILVGVFIFIALAPGASAASPGAQPSGPAAVPGDFGSPTQIGGVLFSRYLFPFEVTSVLLLVAMIGAVVLTRDDRRQTTDDRQQSEVPAVRRAKQSSVVGEGKR
jgi:NADH-quinone oxidoreductase subunit J